MVHIFKINLVFALLIGMRFCGFAQQLEEIKGSRDLKLEFGYEIHKFHHQIFVSAYHNRLGFQLFEYADEQLSCLTCRLPNPDPKLKNFADVRSVYISNLFEHHNTVFFFASGKDVESGIYAHTMGKPKLIEACESMAGNFVLHNNEVVTQVFKRNEKGTQTSHLVSIREDNRATTRTLKLMQTVPLYFIISYDKELITVGRNGNLHRIKNNELEQLKSLYTNIQNPFIFNNQLFYQATKSSDNQVVLVGRNIKNEEINYGSVVPNLGMLRPLEPCLLKDELFFISSTEKSGCRLYKINHKFEIKELLFLQDYANSKYVDGLASVGGIVYLSMRDWEGKDDHLYSLSSGVLTERDPRYISDIHDLTNGEDQILFRAKEFSSTALFAQTPAKPPIIVEAEMNAFNFWQPGKMLGQVEAYDENGKVKYYIVAGNEQGLFQIDKYTGEVSVSSSLMRATGVYDLEVAVENVLDMRKSGHVHITIKQGKIMNTDNVIETLLFFPDFQRRGYLTTQNLSNGTVVGVYDMNFYMVDELTVRNGDIKIGAYPPGFYFLNVVNTKNLYQKIELK